MPCQGPPEPSYDEIMRIEYRHDLISCVEYVLEKLNLGLLNVEKANNDQLTRLLCGNLRELRDSSPEKFDELVYNAKDSKSRKLADWWEKHEKEDRKRLIKEKEEQDKKKVKEERKKQFKALIKTLSKEEINLIKEFKSEL